MHMISRQAKESQAQRLTILSEKGELQRLHVSNPRQILKKTQTEANIAFKEKYPQIKMGQRTLEKLKPVCVFPPRAQDWVSCCSCIHIKANQVFQSCTKFGRQLNPQPQQNQYPVLNHHHQCIGVRNALPKDDSDSYPLYYLGSDSNNCGVQKFEDLQS